MIHHGDCLEVMPTLGAESIDAIVTDPPYGLGFMGKAWDHAAGADSPMRRRPEVDAVNTGMSRQGGRQWAGTDGQRRQARDAREYQAWCESWAAEMLRVAKPGAYLLAFGGTRTVHRMTCAIEDAGWIIRDMLVWGYASGFPKGRANLKPAWEPIVMARKPGPLRMLNIDGCRIGVRDERELNRNGSIGYGGSEPQGLVMDGGLGRWPANIVLTDPIFDGGWDGVVGGGIADSRPSYLAGVAQTGAVVALGGGIGKKAVGDRYVGYDEEPGGTYSRFFLVPKAARSDREPVLGGLSGLQVDERIHAFDEFNTNVGNTVAARRRNSHPTVKPTDLMRHLVRLVTPKVGVVLDPFLGSGTTALAAEMEGFPWIGIEREAEYVEIAEARLNGTQRGLGLTTEATV